MYKHECDHYIHHPTEAVRSSEDEGGLVIASGGSCASPVFQMRDQNPQWT